MAGDRPRRGPPSRRLRPPRGVRRVKRALITGGAGLHRQQPRRPADRRRPRGRRLRRLHAPASDASSSGSRPRPRAEVVEGDVLDGAALRDAMEGCDTVFHLAANADVRFGLEHPSRDLEQNTIAHVQRARGDARGRASRASLFSSTGSVYGEPEVVPDARGRPFPVQTSLYGASKLAGEGLIQAYCEGYGFTGVIFRFVSILGERYTHGHVFDFYRALREDPSVLGVLGRRAPAQVVPLRRRLRRRRRCCSRDRTDAPGASTVYNLGTDEVVGRRHFDRARSARHLGVAPRLEYTGGVRGWIGDSPLIHLDCTRAARRSAGQPQLTIAEARAAHARLVRRQNAWVYEPRALAMSVIFTRAPLRISLGGGGTDLPSYYREHGGFLVAGAIDKYVYMLTHTVFQRRFRMKYSEFEEVDDPRRSATRSCARRCCATGAAARSRSPRSPTSPPGTGLGSSGAFTVCLLKALAWRGACRARPAARRGGVPDRDRRARRARRQAGPVRRRARRHLRLHVQSRRLGRRRAAAPVRRDARGDARQPPALLHRRDAQGHRRSSPTRTRAPAQLDAEMVANLDRTKEIGLQSRALLEAGDLDGLRAS